MAQTPDTAQADSPPAVEYEHPLTERMRNFLRLEFLHRQTLHHADSESGWDTRAAVAGLLDIVAIMYRSDLRGEVLRELERQAELLRKFRNLRGVDVDQCDQLLSKVERLRDTLTGLGPARFQALKESSFLNAVKQRTAIPGGTCVFDLPEYTFWLTQPFEDRKRQLEQWLDTLQPLFDSLNEVLWLIRNISHPQRQVAKNGMYQQAFDRGDSPILLRVLVPAEQRVYPEISGGQKRFTVRFMRWNSAGERAPQTDSNVNFLLALC